MFDRDWDRRIDEAFKTIFTLKDIRDFPNSLWFVTRDWLQISRIILTEINHLGQLVEIASLEVENENEYANSSLPPTLKKNCLEISRKWRVGDYVPGIYLKSRDSVISNRNIESSWSILATTKDTFFLIECYDIEHLEFFFKVLSQFLLFRFQERQPILKLNPLERNIDLEKIGLSPLSDRQCIIASMISEGKTNREIATELKFSESLVRKETMKIFEFYGIAKREELSQFKSGKSNVYIRKNRLGDSEP